MQGVSADAVQAVRVAVFGAGNHARRAHLPNLRALPRVEIVAIADGDIALAQAAADDFAPQARVYNDGHTMLQKELQLDVLFSIVPAFARRAGCVCEVELGGLRRDAGR